MQTKCIAIGAVATLCAAAAAQKPWLARLRALAGDWAVVDGLGERTDLRAIYDVAAGGAAVIETLLAGSPEETVTVYHRAGARISANQVSGRGAVQLAPGKVDEDTLLLVAADAAPGELSRIALSIGDADSVQVEWTFAGEDAPRVRSFELRREARVEQLAAEVARMRVSLDSLQRELDRRLKRELTVEHKGQRGSTSLLETRSMPPGAGWAVSGVPMRRFLHQQSRPFATTFSAQGDKGMTVAHYGFKAGPGCTLKFAVLGGHGYIAIVEETKAPPRRIREIEEFSAKLVEGAYGPVITRIVGGHWKDHPRSVEWDLSKFTGKALRLYVVDAVTNHYGQIGISEISILEEESSK